MARIPHPLAGKTGEGPPIAPPNWKWRAGNRVSDMYFYSPSGKQFRSRPELANYLQTVDNPPDANLFCWRVTEEVLKNGYVPRDDVLIPKAAKRKAQSPGGGGNKRLKNSTGTPVARLPIPFATASDIPMRSTKEEPASLLAPSVAPISPKRVGTFPSAVHLGHQSLNGRDRAKGKRCRVSVPHSFKSVLAGRSSFKWLYDSDTLEKFLEEARRLKSKDVAEINEMRNVLLERQLDMNNICKYPNSAIRVFVRLLRNEEAPGSMGKIELAGLCVNWKCKKRHHWCLLEAGRMNSPRKNTKLDDVKSATEYSNTHLAMEKTVTGYDSEFFEQPERMSTLHVRLPEEPILSGGYKDDCPAGVGLRRQEEATKLMPQNDSQFVLPASGAPDLCGESIVVITGYKSCASKGTGIVHQGDEAAHLNGGSFSKDHWPSTSASGRPSTSSKPGEMHCRASVSDVSAPYAIMKRNGSPEPGLGSKGGELLGGSPALMMSEAMDLMSRVDKRLQEPASTFSNVSESERTWNPVQESVHGEEQQISASSASAPDGGESFHQGDLCMKLSSPDVMELRMVKVPQNPTSPPNSDDAAFPSTQPAPQSLPAAVKQEPPHPGDLSPTATNTRQVSHVSEAFVSERDEGTTEEHLNNCSREENLSLALTETIATRDSLSCWCKICGNDFSFCRGCMCSFCRKVLQPGEDGTVIKCICGHVCHMDCALAANAAGVVKELGLDGELWCPSCSRKVDLWLFFQQQFDLILSLSEGANMNLKVVEKLLLQALQLVKGTEKIKYKFIEGLVTEAYELIRKFPLLALIQILLRAVRDELHFGPGPGAETLEGGLGATATPEEIDWLKDEHLTWEFFNNAKRERLLMEQVVKKLHNAYADAVTKREQARSVSKAMVIREPERLEDNVNPSVLEELLISQQATFDREFKKLWDMRKFEAGDFTTIGALDASASAWIESLKLQRVVVEAARTKLQHLKNLRR